MILKMENRFRNHFSTRNSLNISFIICITIIAFLIRLLPISFQSWDYTYCLQPWMEKIRQLGGFKSLGVEIGNYNIIYMTIMCIFSYLPFKDLYCIKLLSIIFDFILAFFSALLVKVILKDKNNKDFLAILTYALVLILPTVFTNSAVWGQCDVIYVTFIIVSLYFILKNKNILAFIMAGVAFSFKLQFVFVLPLYVIIYFKNKNFSIFNFFIIPLVNLITCIPAMIMGRSLIDCMSIYFAQTSQTPQLSYNFTNIYKFIGTFFSTQSQVILLFALAVMGIIAFYIIYTCEKISNESIISIALISVLLLVSLLPYMHDRYAYCAEVLAIIYVIIYRKDFYIVVITQIGAMSEYLNFLCGFNQQLIDLITIAYIVCVIIFVGKVLSNLPKENSKDLKKGTKNV